jgi:hypothetical protein
MNRRKQTLVHDVAFAAKGSEPPFAASCLKVRSGPVVLFYRRSQFRHKQCTESYLVLAAARFADI